MIIYFEKIINHFLDFTKILIISKNIFIGSVSIFNLLLGICLHNRQFFYLNILLCIFFIISTSCANPNVSKFIKIFFATLLS